MPLDKAMEQYRNLSNKRASNEKLKIFPLMTFERYTWGIAGSDIQQTTSPVFRFHIDDYQSYENPNCIVWNSLTEMFADHLSGSANWFAEH